MKELSMKFISAHAYPAVNISGLGELEIEYVVNCLYIQVLTECGYWCVCMRDTIL